MPPEDRFAPSSNHQRWCSRQTLHALGARHLLRVAPSQMYSGHLSGGRIWFATFRSFSLRLLQASWTNFQDFYDVWAIAVWIQTTLTHQERLAWLSLAKSEYRHCFWHCRVKFSPCKRHDRPPICICIWAGSGKWLLKLRAGRTVPIFGKFCLAQPTWSTWRRRGRTEHAAAGYSCRTWLGHP